MAVCFFVYCMTLKLKVILDSSKAEVMNCVRSAACSCYQFKSCLITI